MHKHKISRWKKIASCMHGLMGICMVDIVSSCCGARIDNGGCDNVYNWKNFSMGSTWRGDTLKDMRKNMWICLLEVEREPTSTWTSDKYTLAIKHQWFRLNSGPRSLASHQAWLARTGKVGIYSVQHDQSSEMRSMEMMHVNIHT